MTDAAILKSIRALTGTTGEKGWPVILRDRVAYPPPDALIVTSANVAVTFLWTMRDYVIPKLDTKSIALAANFYTPSGLHGMVRNILANPFIRYIIMFGEEYSSKSDSSAGGRNTEELTSANAIRAFFSTGVNKDRHIDGFGNAVRFDNTIPLELINDMRNHVELIDLNLTMPDASLDEKIAEANRLSQTLEKLPAFRKPEVFPIEESQKSFPYEGGPIIVHGTTIPNAWIRMIHNIYRYGVPSLMNADTDRWVKEINNMVVVIHDPQNNDLTVNPFLVPLTAEKIAAYQAEILSPTLPEGKAYTYGNKLRAYHHPAPEEVKNLETTKEYTDFEFKQGPWINENVTFTKSSCEINQIADIIEVLNRDPYSKACVAVTWHVADELMRKHKSSPCLVLLQPVIQNKNLNLTIYFRSHDMVQGWPENAYGCAAIQKEIAEGTGTKPGIITIISASAQIYQNYYQQVEEVLKTYRNQITACTDARGNFQIHVAGREIVVSLLDPCSSQILETFRGTSAYELLDTIMSSVYTLEGHHAMYLGTELAVAELALRNKTPYEQDSGLSQQSFPDLTQPEKSDRTCTGASGSTR